MIKYISETEALDFVSKQEHKDVWHKDFYYWFNLQDDEMYDGFLISSKPGVGIKLGRWLEMNINYKTNWSCCDRKYIKFNERLGFKIKSIDSIENREVILLCRKKY